MSAHAVRKHVFEESSSYSLASYDPCKTAGKPDATDV